VEDRRREWKKLGEEERGSEREIEREREAEIGR
jgi:hypothetical protein